MPLETEEVKYIQGHLCTIWNDGKYERTRDINKTKESFEALLKDLNTDYIDVIVFSVNPCLK